MIRSTLPILLAAAASVLFISCKKDSNSSPENSNPTTNSTYLSRIAFFSKDGGTAETLDVSISYVFDSQKRVIMEIDSSLNNGGTGLELWETTEYFYQGADTLPYKRLTLSNPATTLEYDTTLQLLTYNSAGLLIRDTGFHAIHGITASDFFYSNQTYQYSGSTITGRRENTYPDPSGNYITITTDTAQTDVNGNITQNVSHRGNEMTVSAIVWDNHPSPFATLSNFRASFIFPFGETFLEELPSRNNRLHITELTTAFGNVQLSYEEDYTGQYSYGDNGYPSQILHDDPSSPGSTERTVFEYRTL